MRDDVRADVLEAVEDDYVCFAELPDAIEAVTGGRSDLIAASTALAVALVLEGAVVPGDFAEGRGFTPWITTSEESAARIEREGAALIASGVRPEVGDVCRLDRA